MIRANLDASQRRGTVRAAMRIDAAAGRGLPDDDPLRGRDAVRAAPAACAGCATRPPTTAGSWSSTKSISAGTRRGVNYVFRADLVADRSIAFRQVSGDFKANEGVWELEPAADGATHAAALPRLHRSAGLRPELAGALDLQARTAADADRPAPTL